MENGVNGLLMEHGPVSNGGLENGVYGANGVVTENGLNGVIKESRLDDAAGATNQQQQRGLKNGRRPNTYQLVTKKMLHMRPPSHSSVSPSQKSDTSADSSDSSSDGLPTKQLMVKGSKSNNKSPSTTPDKHILSNGSAAISSPQPRIENILSEGLPEIVTTLLKAYGLPSHAGFIDPSFSIYIPPTTSSSSSAFPEGCPDYAISFKPCHGVAVMYGDPLCDPNQVGPIFDSFCAYAKRRKWRVAVIGATQRLVDHAVNRAGWGAMEFAVASVLNPTTDVIAVGKGFQTIRRDNRRLASAGWKVEVYDPSGAAGEGRSLGLEAELSGLYKEWREERNARGIPQTYSTVLEPWLFPGACRHLYVRSPDTGKVAGLATMIRLGGVDGYLLDPLLAVAGSPRGVTEILTTQALSLLQDEGATYLTFGFAPLMNLGSILNVPALVEKPSRVCYSKLQEHLGLGGKKIWHEKWRPERSEGNWLLFPPGGVTGYVTVTRALCGVTHIRLKDVIGKSGAVQNGKKENVESKQVNGRKGGAGSEGAEHNNKQANGRKGIGSEGEDHSMHANGGGRQGPEKEQDQVGESDVEKSEGKGYRYNCIPWTNGKSDGKGARYSCMPWASNGSSCMPWPLSSIYHQGLTQEVE
ncbi:unnamed protein product [Calypogeia fissa]